MRFFAHPWPPGGPVDHHVSAILRKLDVRTRGEAGVQAARRGLIPHE